MLIKVGEVEEIFRCVIASTSREVFAKAIATIAKENMIALFFYVE
jgi:hypothetical protein